jgi:adenylate kinase
MKMVLLGPPGAGKGTQAKVLSVRLELPHISTGDLLRQNVKDATSLGKEAKDYMDKGLLVPDELVAKMLKERFLKPDINSGFILDGYPRTLNQAKTLDLLLKDVGSGIDAVIYLETSEAVVVQRLSGRLVCSSCGLNFHATNMPPKVKGVCDNCKGSLYQRSDDKEETVRKRLEVYNREVAALIEYYEKEKKLYRISADLSAEIVLNEIIDLAKKF